MKFYSKLITFLINFAWLNKVSTSHAVLFFFKDSLKSEQEKDVSFAG